MKRKLIQIKVTDEFKEIIEVESKKRNMTMTAFISDSILRNINVGKKTKTGKKTFT